MPNFLRTMPISASAASAHLLTGLKREGSGLKESQRTAFSVHSGRPRQQGIDRTRSDRDGPHARQRRALKSSERLRPHPRSSTASRREVRCPAPIPKPCRNASASGRRWERSAPATITSKCRKSRQLSRCSRQELRLSMDDIVVSIHCGSRGLGRQIGTDFFPEMALAAPAHAIALPDWPARRCALSWAALSRRDGRH